MILNLFWVRLKSVKLGSYFSIKPCKHDGITIEQYQKTAFCIEALQGTHYGVRLFQGDLWAPIPGRRPKHPRNYRDRSEVHRQRADTAIRPSHTLRCYTTTTECTKGPAMYKNSMRCSAMHFPTCWKFCSRISRISQLITVRFPMDLSITMGISRAFI